MSEETNSTPANVGPGETIAGYRLEEQIGQGGMAVVYRAHDERLDRRVALKLLAPGLASDTAFRTRFIRESRAAAAVDHPNIIPVYDAGDAGGFLFIAMRFVQGGDVRSLFAAGQVLSPARVWNIISQVAAALDAAHAHDLIHRDVKPANMLLDTSSRNTGGKRGQVGDETDHVYLSDFGISKQTLASHLTSTGQFVGTLDYIAPETIEGRVIDGSVDQYSLACATYELMTGEPPFRRDLGLALLNAHLSAPPPSLVAKRPELPPSVDLVLAKAMAKTSADRYASCVEFATDLGKAIGMVPGTPLVAAAAPGPGAAAWPATELATPVTAPDAWQANQGPQAPSPAPPTNLQPAAAAHQPPAPIAAVPFPPAEQFPAQQSPIQQSPAQQTPAQPTPVQQAPQWPAGVPGSFDAGTQYAPPQDSGPQGQGQGPQGQGPQGQGQFGQTPPQQHPQLGGWPTGGQQSPQGGYGQYPQYQQQYPPGYGTGQGGGPPAQGWQQYPPANPGGTWPQQQQQQPPAQPKRSRGILIGAVVATLAIAIAAVAVVYLVIIPHHKTNSADGKGKGSTTPISHSKSASTTPTQPTGPTAQGEATTVNNLLSTSAVSREQWDSNTLVTNVGNCTSINSDVSQISDIANERTRELNQAQGLQVSAIPGGATLKNQLMTALRISLSIDNDYLAWAQQQQSSGCSVGTNSTYYDQATNEDPQATTDKMAFLNTWNPIASDYKLEQFSAGQI